MTELKEDTKAQIILGNTYHLYLRPGIQILEQAGGLHKFNTWDRPILTDSGGFQVFSLSENRELHEEGAEFRSHLDGSKHKITPEKVMDIERSIGADIIMAFDECCPGDADYNYAKTTTGSNRALAGSLFRPLQQHGAEIRLPAKSLPDRTGDRHTDLRQRAAENVARKGADGNAIGGLAVGEPTDKMYEMIEVVNDILPKDKPRYLMGVGTPINLLEKGIERGIDMFDCIMPTRNGRNGQLFTRFGTINMRNKKWENDFSPVDPDGHSYVDTLYSKAYLHHLIKAKEMLGLQIASIHNLAFYLWLVKEARAHIIAGDFTTWKSGMVRQLANRL